MTQNVVIDFTEKGLEKIVDDLVKIGAISEKQAADYKASNDIYRSRQETVNKLFSSQTKLSTETSKANKSMDDLSKSTANVAKNITNGATNEAIKKTGQLIDENTAKVKKYDNSLTGLKQQYKDLVAQAIEVGEKTPFGEKILKQAGEVKDRIADIQTATKNFGSDTATFNAIGEGIRGIGAGFQIAQGAQALFGSGNKDLEKQLVKIQATMALVNGLTEVQNLLQKESAFRLGLVNAQTFIQNSLSRIGITFKTQENVAEATGETIKKRVVVVQAIENGLTSQSVIVRGAATAAQWLLNNAMLAFPLLALIGGLTILVGLFGGLGENLGKAAELQTALNEVEKENIKIMEAQDEFINKLSADRQAAIQRDIELLTAQKASTEEIRIKEQELQKERTFNAFFQKAFHGEEIDNLSKNRLAVIGLTASLAAYNKEKALSTDSDDKEAFDKQIEAIKGKLEIAQELVKIGEQAQENAGNVSLERSKLAFEQQQQIAIEGLAFQKDIITAKLRFAKEASDQQLALQLALAKNERDTSIANLKASNESRADIEATYLEKVAQLNEAYRTAQLNKQKSLIAAELTNVRIGSEAELELKLKNLEIENEIELNNRKLTNEQKIEITAKYLKQVRDMSADFAKKQIDDEINTQLLVTDAKLQGIEKNSAKELELKQRQLALQEQLEINNIDRNIQGTALGEARKNDIIAQYVQKNKQLELDAIEVVISARERENARIADILQRRSDIEANNVNTSLERRQELELEAFDNKFTLLEKEKNAETDRFIAGELTYEQYQQRLTAIQQEQLLIRGEQQNAADAIERENFQRNTDMIVGLANDALNLKSSMIQAGLDSQLDSYNQDLRANEQAYKNKQISEAQYLAQKEQTDRKMKKARKDAAEDEKQIALFQIVINTAQAAMKALATAPNYVVGAVEAALAIAFGAIQYGIADAKPIPEFAKGTENAPEGWAWVGEEGPELVWMKAGSKVKTHEESVKMSKAATPTLRNTYFEKVDRAPIPSEKAQQAMAILAQQGLPLDIGVLSKMIGNEVGNHLSRMPLTMMSFDKQGFQASVVEGNATNRFLDSRYSSN